MAILGVILTNGRACLQFLKEKEGECVYNPQTNQEVCKMMVLCYRNLIYLCTFMSFQKISLT